MKDFRSKLSCIARRSTGLSNGGAFVTRRVALPFIGLTSQIACGAWLRTSLTSGIDTSYGKVMSNLPAAKARIAVERLAIIVFDAVEIGPPRLPVIRVARHLDRLVGFVFDESERPGADRLTAHLARRNVARINRRIAG